MRGTRVAVRIMAEVKWKKHSLNFKHKESAGQSRSRSSTSLSVLLGIAFMLQAAGGAVEKFLNQCFIYTPCLGIVRDCRSDVHRDFSVAAVKEDNRVDTVVPWMRI